MFSLLRPYIFGLDPEVAHDLAIKSLKFNFVPKSFFKVEGEEIQTLVYSTGKENGYEKKLREWFILIYEVLFGSKDGPRMGFFISFFGVKETIKLINEKIKIN